MRRLCSPILSILCIMVLCKMEAGVPDHWRIIRNLQILFNNTVFMDYTCVKFRVTLYACFPKNLIFSVGYRDVCANVSKSACMISCKFHCALRSDNAHVSPIFKKGAKGDPGNNRPVSKTSIVCKLLESIIRDKITEHLDQNKLINPSQHGFV